MLLGEKVLQVPAWGFDPALAIAVRFAIAEGLIAENTTGYEISEAGVFFVKEILKDTDLFGRERSFLSAVGKGLTEGMVEATASGWGGKVIIRGVRLRATTNEGEYGFSFQICPNLDYRSGKKLEREKHAI